jgi:hypothetical protein
MTTTNHAPFSPSAVSTAPKDLEPHVQAANRPAAQCDDEGSGVAPQRADVEHRRDSRSTMHPSNQNCSSIASLARRRVRTVIRTVAGVAATVLVADVATASPPQPAAAACVVDVSDWPVGVLPDDASAAFGPTALAACKKAVADWPLGALPDDATTLFNQAPAATPNKPSS